MSSRGGTRTALARETVELFERMKTYLVTPPILRPPNYEKDFVISVDASTDGIGATIGQYDDAGKPYVIAYISRATTASERKSGITDLECTGMEWALSKFRCYVDGHHVTVYTYHQALEGPE